MADQSGGFMMREYRKGNWTLNETMVLIEAKKMDDERRMRRSIGLPPPEQQQQQDNRSSSSSTNKPAELRWKWIEDYCWRKGCMRSQNQCNDKWDNLMRDYKKVREYERRRVESSFTTADQSSSSSAPTTETASYWKMEKSERKERNLPSNMLPQTYQALFEVVEGKTLPSSTAATAVTAAVAAAAAAIGSGNGSGGSGQIQKVIQQSLGFVVPKHFEPPVLLPLPPVLPPPPPSQPPPQPLPRPLLLPPPPPPPSFHHAHQPILPTKDSSSDSDTSEYSDTSPAKRRRTMPTTTAGPSGGAEAEEAGGSKREEETTTTVAVALSRSASVIANAIRESEERKDRRHKEVMSVEERRLKMEETNVEINRQGMNGLVEAINKLASSIFALASSSSSSSSRHNNNNQHQGGPPP